MVILQSFKKISVKCNVQLTPTKEQRKKKNTKCFKVVFQFIRNIDRVVLLICISYIYWIIENVKDRNHKFNFNLSLIILHLVI